MSSEPDQRAGFPVSSGRSRQWREVVQGATSGTYILLRRFLTVSHLHTLYDSCTQNEFKNEDIAKKNAICVWK